MKKNKELDKKALSIVGCYHIVLHQLRARYLTDTELSADQFQEVCLDLKPYRKLQTMISIDEIKIINRMLWQEAEIITRNRDNSIWDESPMLLTLKDQLLHMLYATANPATMSYMEMMHDIEHGGQYVQGEVLFHGLLECAHCGLIKRFHHLQEIDACNRCGSDHFERPRYFPRKLDLTSNYHY
jgi:predicted Zn-ribbon and HTH transcriptional regulator